MKNSKHTVFRVLTVICLCLFATASMAKKPPKGGGGTGTNCQDRTGVIIFDTTANPGDQAISVNLNLADPCGSKGDTAISTGFGNNAINIDDFQVLNRDLTQDPNGLKLFVGISGDTIVQDQFGTANQNTQFAAGGQLFNLGRLRTIADWMSSGTTAIDTTLASGTYGTISYQQFLQNIRGDKTMYGVVRVLIPLEAGSCTDKNNCGRNALGSLVDQNTLYGLCTTSNALCACSPKAKGTDIKNGNTICGVTLDDLAPPNNKKIRVRGSLFWDFVASADSAVTGLKQGDPVPLDFLPFAPRELYFKVTIPINVNWEYDADNDGAMDNMFYIKSISDGGVAGAKLTSKLDFSKVPASSKADFEFYTGKALTQAVFDALDVPSQYHLMMPTGYATSWAEAFSKLGITGSEWTSIPGITPALTLPKNTTGTITVNDVRSENFEDMPAYLYSGGLIDMHSHVNISGLLYVPQGMELEAKDLKGNTPPPARQYISGAIIVRDTFFIEAGNDTITVMSSDPPSYSTALISETASRAAARSLPPDFSFSSTVAGNTVQTDSLENAPPDSCYNGCSGPAGASPGGGSTHPAGASRWIEVRPQDE